MRPRDLLLIKAMFKVMAIQELPNWSPSDVFSRSVKVQIMDIPGFPIKETALEKSVSMVKCYNGGISLPISGVDCSCTLVYCVTVAIYPHSSHLFVGLHCRTAPFLSSNMRVVSDTETEMWSPNHMNKA